MAKPRKICFVTGTRAEYGLLFWLMKEIEADAALDLQLIVTGTHLEPRFGNTVDAIVLDGFKIDARVPLNLTDDSAAGITDVTGAAVAGIGRALAALSPDLLVLLGDRYEILAAAVAATLHRVPIAHLHGGEITEGANDDAMRHAITKLASLHFPAARAYGERIVQMGEMPDTVITVGAPGLDHLQHTTLLDAAETAHELSIEEGAPYFLITLHPATLGNGAPEAEIDALLDALDAFDDHIAVFTGVNADRGRDAIAGRIDAYVKSAPQRARLFPSLGQRRYLSAIKYCDAVLGNSSSGIIEAPAMDVPTVNIGPRQRGRLRASTIIDCEGTPEAIRSAITRALSPAFQTLIEGAEKPYGAPGASKKIATTLGEVDLSKLQRKTFYDLPGVKAV